MKHKLFILFFTVFSGICFSQSTELSLPKVIPPSPVAMELAKYITYPVDLSNGLVKISIPLYEIVEGDIRIPITLNYHASGQKPNIRTNDWLENGWSISTGPSLSRNINGGEDERFYFYEIVSNPQPTYQQLNLIANQTKDITLDEFYYSLLNNSGRLYFKRNTSNQLRPVTIPKDPIKVTLPVVNRYDNYIHITDTKGLQYLFGGSERKFKDFVLSAYGGTNMYVPSSWKINKIFSSMTNRTVSYDYYDNISQFPFLRESDAITIVDEISCQCENTIPAIQVQGKQIPPNLPISYYTCTMMGQLIPTDYLDLRLPSGYQFPGRSNDVIYQQNSYIKSIHFSGGRVEFSKNENGRKGLTSIRVYNYNNTLVKQIEFFQTPSPYDNFPLLILNQIKTTYPGETESECYTFQYNSPAVNKDSRAIDKWGYYNAANNTTLVPPITTQVVRNNYPFLSMQTTITIPGGNRETNEAAMLGGMLTTIIYPTGGKSTFVYEAHRYKDINGNTKLAGGLRIKQIQDDDANGKITYRNFKYSTSPNSIDEVGILNTIPMGNMYSSDDNFIYYSEVNCQNFLGEPSRPESSYKERRWSDNSLVNLLSENGSSVSYPHVTERISSSFMEYIEIGEKKHSFNVTPSYPTKYGNTSIVLDSKDGWSKGNKQSDRTTKNTTSSTATIAQSDYNHILDFGYGTNEDKITQRYVFKRYRIYGLVEALVPEQYKVIDYIGKDLSTGRLLLSEQKDKTVESNGTIIQTTNYAYDTYGNIAQTTKSTSLSDAEKTITTILYPKDMVDQGRNPASIYSDMVNSYNMVSIPIEVKEYKNSVSTGNLLTTLTTGYAKFNGRIIAPKEITATIKNNTGVPRKIQFNDYDNRGNILEQVNIDGTKEVYLWGYRGQHPVARIVGSDWSTIKSRVDTTSLYNGTESQIQLQLNNLRSNYNTNNNVHVSTYLYKPLIGMVSETDPSGRAVYYEYDGFGRLKRIKDANGKIIEQYDYHYK